MTPTAQRIAIAMECPGVARIDGAGVAVWTRDSREEFDPLEDLNAMHEAESTLTHSASEWSRCDEYESQLNKLTGNMYVRRFPLLHATAAQRAEAFLKTIGKWATPATEKGET